MSSPEELLIVFCKAPRAGFVKTRMAVSVGPDEACRRYRMLTERVLSSLRAVRSIELRFAPDDALSEVQGWRRSPHWSFTPQGSGDLGARLARAFQENFDRGYERVVVIGTDCPEVSESDIRESFETLKSADVVLGPAMDGGYWLIGLSQPHPFLFEDQAWGTETVFQETVARARGRRLDTMVLRALSDVDTASDWDAFLRRQGGSLDRAFPRC